MREIVAAAPARYFYANRYNNPANWQAHYATTGPEIWRQTEGGVTHFVAGLGTTGTFMGAGRYLKERNPDIELVAVQPEDELAVIEGLKHLETAIVPGIYDAGLPDRFLGVAAEDAWATTRRLAQRRRAEDRHPLCHALLARARPQRHGDVARQARPLRL